MKELLEIIKACKRLNTPMALATIVKTAGSTYRRAGARMLIISEDHTIGCISGGCLDRDVVLHGLDVIRSGKPALITYDTSPDHDLILGTGTGCNGLIELLVEPLPPCQTVAARSHILGFMDNLNQTGHTGAIATVISTRGGVDMRVGDRLMMEEHGGIVSSATDPETTEVLGLHARSALMNLNSELVVHESENGSAEIFVETCLPQVPLVVVGAGQDADPLVRMAHELGYKVTVLDARPALANRERFPLADQLVVTRPEEDHRQYFSDGRTVAVIMTHNYLTDQGWLGKLLPLGLAYLGLMGPRKRAEKMLFELQQDGLEIKGEDLTGLHNPIGLDIGAETPGQIALAILAEIQTTLAGHEAGKMRQKKGSFRLSGPEVKTNSLCAGPAPVEASCLIPA